MRKKLTASLVEHAKPPATGRLEIYDSLTPGLALRLTSKGGRSWTLMLRVGPRGQRRLRRLTLGSARTLSLPEAREAGREALKAAARGEDPTALPGEDDRRTFAAAAQAYLARQQKNTRPSTYREASRIIDHDLLPRLGDRPISEITRADVDAVIDVVEGRGVTVQVNRTQRIVRAIFGFALDQDWIATSPLARMKQRFKEHSRDRVLSPAEIKWFWQACDELSFPFGKLFQVLLLTAQRRAETATMEWGEVDLVQGRWLIPRQKTKPDRSHEVALSALAVEILANVPSTSAKYVFSLNNGRPVCGFKRPKEHVARRMNELRRQELGLAEGAAPIPRWTLHDLRRTSATRLAEDLKIAPHIVDRLLNHSGTVRGVAGIYNRSELLDERRAALQALGRYIQSLVMPPQGNIIVLRTGPSAA
jgi:integrase